MYLLYWVYSFVLYYVIILFMFIFCYWRILIVIRRQAKVMASHGTTGPSTAQIQAQLQSLKIQSNVTKTMIYVSALYAVSWFPGYVNFAIQSQNLDPTLLAGIYYASVIMAFLFVCSNPFIYAIKFDPVRKVLLGLIPSKKTAVANDETQGTGTGLRTV